MKVFIFSLLFVLVAKAATLTPAELATLNAGGSITLSAPAVIVPPPPVPSSAAIVYNNGAFIWPGDYNYGVTADYVDPTCAEPGTGGTGLRITLKTPWGAWQPYAKNWNYDLTPYGAAGFLVFDLMATNPAQVWAVFALKVGDKPIAGPARNVGSYGPAPIPGTWGTYRVPLADIMTDNGVQLFQLYKFDIQDKTGRGASNSWCVNNVHFSR